MEKQYVQNQADGVPPDEAQVEWASQIAQRILAGESTLQIEFGMSDEALETVYDIAYRYFNQGKYADAERVFAFLLALNPLNHKFCFGLAAAYQMAGKKDLAATYYFLATLTDHSQAAPFFHLGECLAGMNDNAGAIHNLEQAHSLAAAAGQDRLEQRAALMLETLKRSSTAAETSG